MKIQAAVAIVCKEKGRCVCVCVCVALSSPSETACAAYLGVQHKEINSLQSVARISITNMVLLVRNTAGRCVSSPLL